MKNGRLKVFEAENGQEALSIMKKIIPDLIITDISMPILDGFELLNKIKTDNALKLIPVIAYSASVMKDQKDRILKSKFAGLLVKPVMVTQLFSELMKHLKYQLLTNKEQEQITPEIAYSNKILDLPGLIYSLDNKFNDVCKSFEDIQPIDDVGESEITCNTWERALFFNYNY